MKTAISIVLVVLAFVVVWWYIGQNNAATRQDLDDVRRELQAQIDSVMRNTDTLKIELRAVRANTDTLKAGQEVIFRTMKENQGKETSLWDLIIGR